MFARLLAFILVAGTVRAQAPRTLGVLLLDGKTGKPVAHQHFLLFGSKKVSPRTQDRDASFDRTTDTAGSATIQIDPGIRSVFMYEDWHHPCTAKRDFYPVAVIEAKGITSENTCKPGVTRSPEPGQLVIYIRDETLFEKMAH
jgi:hypothetical protein